LQGVSDGDEIFQASVDSMPDLSGNNNHGIQIFRSSQPLLTGGMLFDGLNDRAHVNNSTSLEIDNIVSLSCWVTNSSNLSYDVILAKRTSKINYQFYKHNGDLRFFDGSYEIKSNYTLPTGFNWRHIVIVVNDIDNYVKFYIDGNLEANISDSSFSVVSNTADMRIGDNFFNAWWNGKIDEILLYRRVITEDEVELLYEHSKKYYQR
jgi:hypothetical protein